MAPQTGIKWKPNGSWVESGPIGPVTMRTNSLGYRGPEPRPGQLAFVGDSFTAGWGVNEEDTFARLLDAANFGFPGTGPGHYLLQIRHDVPPGMAVVVFLSCNDVRDMRYSFLPGLIPVFRRDADHRITDVFPPPGLWGWNVWRRSALARVAVGRWGAMELPEVTGEFWRDFEDVMRLFPAGTRFVYVPCFREADSIAPRLSGILPGIIDVSDGMREERFYIPASGHFTPAGHRRFAGLTGPLLR